ncbi:hypothetical protein [Cetobacterium somerae]|uniref:hypothetical protein n=1 Tax=Cetobacterium somerae TaxID=188913 RepID=UPI0038913B13
MFRKILVLLLGIFLIIFGILKLKRDKAIEEPGYLKFMNGNSLVKENKTKEALEEYKLAMDTNEDINIKKNFEIIKNKVEEEKQNQQQDNKQENQDQKNNENEQQKNEQNNKDEKDNQQNNQKQDGNQKNDEKQQQNQQNQQDNQENKSDSQNSNEKKELTPEERAMKQKEEELRSIMQRLEGNEKQAFKNNERVLNTSENKNSENRW